MENTEHVSEIIAQVELLEFTIPAVKQDIVNATIAGALSIIGGVGLIWAGIEAGERYDNVGKAPEIAGSVLASGPLAVGVWAVAAVGLEGWEFRRLKKRAKDLQT